MNNIFFTSDTHFHHKNIVKGTSSWTDPSRCRDFSTLEEHDEKLIANINAVVKQRDILYHLGDWSFGGLEQVYNFWKRLECKNIHLILGNHDHHIENDRTIQDPGTTTKLLFQSVNQYLRKKVGGQDMFLCHYAMRTWDKAHKGNWNLYGHSHGTLPEYHRYAKDEREDQTWSNWGIPNESRFRCMDVGIDTHPEFRPYHFDEISRLMKNRIPLSVDQHNEETN
jgi:calcineurin-like phosphoesterase family protein